MGRYQNVKPVIPLSLLQMGVGEQKESTIFFCHQHVAAGAVGSLHGSYGEVKTDSMGNFHPCFAFLHGALLSFGGGGFLNISTS